VNWKSISIGLNLGAFLLFLATLALVYLWPENLSRLGLDATTGRLALMHEISFLLLLGGFQTSLTAGWRRASLAGAFVVLGEATLMALL
jgi:uncharacterized protein YhhL (DUF1145 family)